MSKIITIYCEGKKGSFDYDILDKAVGDVGAIRIKPIGSKHGANAIIEYQEKGAKKSDFYCFFRDRDFDFPVPQNEELCFDGKKTFHSYPTTIENYLFDTSQFFRFLETNKLNSEYGIDTEIEERYAGTMQHGRNYDAKNMMHTIRLLQVAEEILTTGQLRLRRPNREELLSIKAGNAEYDDLLHQSTELIQRIEAAYASSSLPELPDENAIERILVEMRNELYTP